jgi:beta-phosphoglucomutase-like phosphatase (HAD superfamily)
VKPALLFDLDDTLVVEEPAAAAAFLATAQAALAHHRVDAEMLAVAARERARELWYAAPTHPYSYV